MGKCQYSFEIPIYLQVTPFSSSELHHAKLHHLSVAILCFLLTYDFSSDDKESRKDNRKYSTQVEDIEYLPASHCHVYLKVTDFLTSLCCRWLLSVY